MTVFFCITLVVVACLFLYFLLLSFGFKSWVFKTSRLVVIPRESIPEYLEPCFEAASPLLEGLGFTYRRSFYYPPTANIPYEQNRYAMEFIHDKSGAIARAFGTLRFSAKYYIEFANLFNDGSLWATMNGMKHYNAPGDIPGLTFFDDYLPDDAQAWKVHQERVSNSGKTVVKNAEEIESRMEYYDGQEFEARAQQGIMHPLKKDDFFRLTWKGAFRWVFDIIAARFKERKVNRRMVKMPQLDEAVLESLESQKVFQQAPNPAIIDSKLVTTVSAIFFIVIGAHLSGELSFAFALFAVLALHEAGHWVAMKWFGHNNAAVYLIPLFGSLTAGDGKIQTSPMKQLLIFLAGPLPGILLALIVWVITINIFPASDIPAFLSKFIIILLIVNYLNLLPLFPLDGGRIVEAFLLPRMPRLRFCFVFFSLIILGLTAFSSFWERLAFAFAVLLSVITFNAPVSANSIVLIPLLLSLIFTLAVMLFIFIPAQWSLLRLRLAIGNVNPASESEAQEIISNALQSPKFNKWADTKRHITSDIIVSELINPKQGLIQIICGGVIYGLSLYLYFLIDGYINL